MVVTPQNIACSGPIWKITELFNLIVLMKRLISLLCLPGSLEKPHISLDFSIVVESKPEEPPISKRSIESKSGLNFATVYSTNILDYANKFINLH